MPSIIPGYEYDIFISYRQKDNKGERWVTEFVNALKTELDGTFKEDISIYFDENPHDGLLETHHVDKSLEGKLKCLIFIPIISQTYCDPKSFAWQQEFCVFNKLASEDKFGRDIKLSNGNVASRILPIKIHDLDADDKAIIENEIGGVLRSIDFIFKSAGVNRPLRSHEDHPQDNLNKVYYRDQVNKVANAIKGIISALRSDKSGASDRVSEFVGQPSKKRVGWVAAAILLLAMSLYWIFPKLFAANDRPALEKSIAVLPFVNVSNDQSQEYFSEGLAIEITDKLTKVSGLRVIPAASIIDDYKGTSKNSGQIADELGVSFILEGSVRRAENNLRINVRLLEAGRNELIWSETLDKPFTEVLQVQSDIAAQVAGFLQITLTESDKGSLAYIPTRFISAYDYYLRSMELSYQRSQENEKAIELLQEAKRIDPNFVEAWAQLGFRFCKQMNDDRGGETWLDSALLYGEKALSLSPNSSIANRSMGFVRMTRAEYDEANKYLRKADRLDSKTGSSLRPLSSVQVALGGMDSAYYYANKLVRMDPKSGAGFSQKVKIFKRLAQWDSCQRNVERAIRTDQRKAVRDLAIFECIDYYIKARSFDQALKLIDENYRNEKDPRRMEERMNYLGQIYALQGDWDAFAKIVDESDEDWAALLYKHTNRKGEFDRLINKMKLENPQGENLLLLTNNFAAVMQQIKAKSKEANFSEYQLKLADPFAQEFIQTPEFKAYFADYDNWAKEMITNIQKMNQ